MWIDNEFDFELEELPIVAKFLIDKLSESNIYCFEGEMGSGKTTLAQSIAKVLGVNSSVSSPTFSLINQYPANAYTIYHSDLYRISTLEELILTGFEEELYRSQSIHIIEWYQIAIPLLPLPYHKIELTKSSDVKRRLRYQLVNH